MASWQGGGNTTSVTVPTNTVVIPGPGNGTDNQVMPCTPSGFQTTNYIVAGANNSNVPKDY